MKKIISLILMLALGVFFCVPAIAQCPGCWKNLNNPTGSGTNSNGQRILKVQIDSSWDDTPGHTNATIWNAVFGCGSCSPPIHGAMDRWNNATGSSGQSMPYVIVADQTTTTPDIVVQNGTVTGGSRYESTTSSHHPAVMTLDPRNLTAYDAVNTTAGRVAHAIGHVMGLSDYNKVSNCADTIMNGSDPDGSRPVSTPTQNDVDRVNAHFNDYTNNCTVNRANSNDPEADPDAPAPQGYDESGYTFDHEGYVACAEVYLVVDHYWQYEDGHLEYIGTDTYDLGFYCGNDLLYYY